MYAPTIDRPAVVRTDADLDTGLLFIDEFDTWTIEDLATFPSYLCNAPDPTSATPTDA